MICTVKDDVFRVHTDEGRTFRYLEAPRGWYMEVSNHPSVLKYSERVVMVTVPETIAALNEAREHYLGQDHARPQGLERPLRLVRAGVIG